MKKTLLVFFEIKLPQEETQMIFNIVVYITTVEYVCGVQLENTIISSEPIQFHGYHIVAFFQLSHE